MQYHLPKTGTVLGESIPARAPRTSRDIGAGGDTATSKQDSFCCMISHSVRHDEASAYSKRSRSLHCAFSAGRTLCIQFHSHTDDEGDVEIPTQKGIVRTEV